MKHWSKNGLLIAVCAMSCFGSDSLRADDFPVTTDDVTIQLDRLRIMLRPLTQEELVVEVDGWMKMLQAKVHEITDAELGVKRKKDQIEEAEKKADVADEKADDAADKADDAAEKVEEADEKEKVPGRKRSADSLRTP